MVWFKVIQIKRSIETMRKYGRILGVFFLCSLIVTGCGKLKRNGTAPVNVPPRVYFADTPPDSSKFSTNAAVYWYGTDIDGFIVAYQYAVMRCDSLKDFGTIQEVKNFLHGIKADSASWVDNLTLRNMIGAHVQAEPGGSSRNVAMFAEMNPDSFTAQYLFLRAVDNGGAVSDIIYKLFYRNNHRPWAIIEADSAFRASNHYCLVDTTTTWKGISISWSGKDSLDYPNPRIQPDFQFKWELVGPFQSSPTALTVDTMAVVDSSLDSIYAEGAGKWIYSRWVSEQLHLFKGLENFGDSGYGWYQLRVRTRDDAYVSTDTPTVMNFRILKPRFRYADQNLKTVLVVDATAYGGKKGGATVDATENAQNTSPVRTFYNGALAFLKQEGIFDDYALWYDPLHKPLDQPPNRDAPGEDVLSRYDLVIVLNSGSVSNISSDNYAKYQDYINVGGRLWIIGLNNFNVSGDRSDVHPAGSIADSYFGIESVFVPNWTDKDSTTLEFVAAEPYGSWHTLPYLQIDTTNCKNLTGWSPIEYSLHFDVNGIPYVCFDGISNTLDYARRIPSKRRMMSFISNYGSNSVMHEKPCAVNYIGSTFRTAEFTFPLELMRNEASDNYPVYEVMKQTIEWFLQDLP